MTELNPSQYARLKALFEAFENESTEARERCVIDLRGEDPALADALERQWSADQHRLAWLDARSTEDGEPVPGYRVIRLLGRGGMGEVFLAERTMGNLVQRVALKRPFVEFLSEASRERFQRERRLLSRLNHPSIVGLIDVGEDPQGRPFLVTPFVDGERIDRWCERTAANLRQRIRLLCAIAAAVSHAHAQLVVHRDIKPANILVTEGGQPMLLDFGIARARDEAAITETGQSALTLRYASPEQVRGDDENGSGIAVDIYALGVLAFELTARTSPYATQDSQAALLNAILIQEPKPPSQHADALSGSDRDLDAVILKCLRKRPDERYRHVDEFRDDLENWLSQRPVQARVGERGYQLKRYWRRRWPWAAAAAAALALGGFHTATLTKQLEATQKERNRAQQTARFFYELFESAAPSETERGTLSAHELLLRSLDHLQADTEQPTEARASLLLAAANAASYLGDHARGISARLLARELLQQVDAPDPELLAEIHIGLADDYQKTGQRDRFCSEAAQGLALFEQALATQIRLHRSALQYVGICADERRDLAAAERAFRQVLQMTQHSLDDPDALYSYLAASNNLALSVEKSGRFQESEQLFRGALQAAEAHHYEKGRALAGLRYYLGRLLVNLGRLEDAKAPLEEGLETSRAWFAEGDQQITLATSLAGLRDVLDGEISRGAERLDTAIARLSQSPGPEHSWTQSVKLSRAVAALEAEQWDDARYRLSDLRDWLQEQPESAAKRKSQTFLQLALDYADGRRRGSLSDFKARVASVPSGDLPDGWRGWLLERWRQRPN